MQDLYGGRAYHELPIIHITSTRNNTKAALTDCNGRSLCGTSCGCEGFRNARKQTTVAAQTVGISISLKAQKLGIKDVRVKMRGLGQNRLVIALFGSVYYFLVHHIRNGIVRFEHHLIN